MTDKENQLIQFILLSPADSYNDLANKMHVSRKTIAAYIKKLKEKGVLTRIGSDRKGYWKVKP